MRDSTDTTRPTSVVDDLLSVVALVCLSVGFLAIALFGWRGTERFVQPLGVPVAPTVGFAGGFVLIAVAAVIAVVRGDS